MARPYEFPPLGATPLAGFTNPQHPRNQLRTFAR